MLTKVLSWFLDLVHSPRCIISGHHKGTECFLAVILIDVPVKTSLEQKILLTGQLCWLRIVFLSMGEVEGGGLEARDAFRNVFF